MPPPLLIGPAAGHAVLVALAASKRVAISSADTVLAFILARLVWYRIPAWIREDVAVRNLFVNNNNNNMSTSTTTELATLTSVIEKLQGLFISASEKLNNSNNRNDDDDDSNDSFHQYLHIAILVSIHLATQFRILYPYKRNKWFISCGERIFNDNNELKKLHNNNKDEPNNNNNILNSNYLIKCLNYAILAYETDFDILQNNLGDDYTIVQHNTLLVKDNIVRPGYVGHYLAVSHVDKTVIIAIRGTTTLEDLLTDCCGRAVSYDYNDDCINNNDNVCDAERGNYTTIEVRAAEEHQIHTIEQTGEIEIISGHERILIKETTENTTDHNTDNNNNNNDIVENHIRCHEGILICAKRLYNEIYKWVEKFIIDRKYKLLLTGHSLGGGVASILAIILLKRYSETLLHTNNNNNNNTSLMQVIVFAPPPVLDHDTAIAASSYTLSVVNNSDIIPRSSLANLAVCIEFQKSIIKRLKVLNLLPNTTSTTIALIKKLTKSMDNVTIDDLIMTEEEVKNEIITAQRRVQLRDPDHLYIPGKVLFMVEEWDDDNNMNNNINNNNNNNNNHNNNDNNDDNNDNNDYNNNNNNNKWHFLLSDGRMDALRFFEVDNTLRLVYDHITASYESSLQQFYKAQQQTT